MILFPGYVSQDRWRSSGLFLDSGPLCYFGDEGCDHFCHVVYAFHDNRHHLLHFGYGLGKEDFSLSLLSHVLISLYLLSVFSTDLSIGPSLLY
jgi:hypothetical protein